MRYCGISFSFLIQHEYDEVLLCLGHPKLDWIGLGKLDKLGKSALGKIVSTWIGLNGMKIRLGS